MRYGGQNLSRISKQSDTEPKMQRTEPCLTRTEGTRRLWKQKSHPSKILCRGSNREQWSALREEYGQRCNFFFFFDKISWTKRHSGHKFQVYGEAAGLIREPS